MSPPAGPASVSASVESGERDPIGERLERWSARAESLAAEGLPMPIQQVRDLVGQLRAAGEDARAEQALGRAEHLLERASHDWTLLSELLRRVDELKELGTRAGLPLGELDARVGDPREPLKDARLSEALLEKASALASKQLAVLGDLMPKYFLTEAQALGKTIQEAKERGHEVTEAGERLDQFVRAMRAGQLRGTALAFLELKDAVTALTAGPPAAEVRADEEQEILREARQLARRLNRIKGRARDASSAARLVKQVKAALAEDRRYSSPEEEIEELWGEVDRLTRERSAAADPEPEPAPTVAPRVPEPALDTTGIPAELLEAANAPMEPAPATPKRRRSRSREVPEEPSTAP
ncbi:MAG TPA: hypothetical protein VGV89_01335 [Thermoplasmata archaeon]|nr:hypothetical protein [Thermoplasmata archaeon]